MPLKVLKVLKVSGPWRINTFNTFKSINPPGSGDSGHDIWSPLKVLKVLKVLGPWRINTFNTFNAFKSIKSIKSFGALED